MRIGELAERVEVQGASVSRDQFNAEKLAWATLATVWAKVQERGGREPVLADRPTMVVSFEVTMRAPPVVLITHKMRLLWRGKVLAIDTVTPLGRDGALRLRCVEVEG